LPISAATASYKTVVNSGPIFSNPTIYTGNNSILLTPFTSTFFQANLQVSMTISWPRTTTQTSNFTIQSIRLGTYFM